MRRDQGLLWLSLHYLLIIVSSQRAGGLDGYGEPRPGRAMLAEQLEGEHLRKVVQRYLSNEEMEAHLKDFVGRCGDIARLSSIGRSVQGRELHVLEISDRPGQQEAEPNVKYVGGVHGDEPSGRMLALALAEWLCANWRTDPQAKRIVTDLHLFLLPAMNPDGFADKTRENKGGKDLNRNFPDRYSKAGILAPTGREQPETKAVMEWTLRTGFVASCSFHEGALLANYPWDGTPNRTTEYWACPDDATFRHLARTYASGHRTMHKSREFKDGITNGASWYPIYGSMQDWNYVVGGCYELTLELSDNKWPPEPTLATLWEDNRQALIDFALRSALGGLRGTVKAEAAKLRAGKGREISPLAGANISVVGIEEVVARSREPFGDFYRPLAPGQWGVLVSKEGFEPFSANITMPEDGSGAVLEVVLRPLGNTGGSSSGGEEGGGDSDPDSDFGGELDSQLDSGWIAEEAAGEEEGGVGGEARGRARWQGQEGGGGREPLSSIWERHWVLLALGAGLVLQGLWVTRDRLRRQLRSPRARGGLFTELAGRVH